jgi:hypothetical protein
VDAADRRALIWLAGIIAVSLLLRLLTWSELADGGQARYVKTTLFGGAAAAVVWLLMRIQVPSTSPVPLLSAAAVLLAGDAIHYVRLANPIARGGPIVAVAATFPDEATARRQWDLETSGAGRVRVEGGALVLESPPGATAYAQARLGQVPDVRVNWWLPVGLAERERDERLTWRAAVQRTHGFYVVAELRSLLIQAVGYGLHITYPDERGAARGHEIAHSVGTDGRPHDWVLTRDGREIALSLDGQRVWAAPPREELGQLKLGETKNDPQHGGSMRVEAASYASTLRR